MCSNMTANEQRDPKLEPQPGDVIYIKDGIGLTHDQSGMRWPAVCINSVERGYLSDPVGDHWVQSHNEKAE